jgi:hypothetical protein
MSSGAFGMTALMAHSKYDTAFNNVSIAILLLSGYSSSHVKICCKLFNLQSIRA